MLTPYCPSPSRRYPFISSILHLFILLQFNPVTATSSKPSFLKDPDKLPVQFITKQNTLVDSSGREFSLDNVVPYNNLFSKDSYVTVNHGRAVVNKVTKGLLDISVYRGEHSDGSTILLSKNENGEIGYVIIAGKSGQDSTHFIPVEDNSGAFLTIADEDYDYDLIAKTIVLGEEVGSTTSSAPTPAPAKAPSKGSSKYGGKGSNRRGGGGGGARNSKRRQTQEFNYVNGDGTSDECDSFFIIPLSIFFDAEFCQLYGGDLLSAVGAVQIIVAAASLHYENNLCSKIELTGINWDTTSCNPDNSMFKDFNRERCGTYLEAVSVYMEDERDSLGISSAAWVHLFTGLPISDNLGCAWLPGPCFSEFVYAVDYMSFMVPDVRGQAFILAHELGHNFNAPHDPTSPDPPNNIMEARFNDASNGFSEDSAATIIETFLDPLNFCIAREPVVSPTFAPSLLPTSATVVFPPVVLPTPIPTQGPTPSPTQGPTPSPTLGPTSAPTLNPTPPPTQGPTPSPTFSPTSRSPGSTTCDMERVLVDPVCIDANENSSDEYTCYDKEDLLAFSTSSSTCRNRAEITVVSCADAFFPAPGFPDDESRRRDLQLAFEDGNVGQRHLSPEWEETYRPLQTSLGKTRTHTARSSFRMPVFDWAAFDPNQKQVLEEPALPLCSASCSEIPVLDQICFQSTTLENFDRWYRIRYTVRDSLDSTAKQASSTVFVVIKKNGQLECSDGDLTTCRDDGEDGADRSRDLLMDQSSSQESNFHTTDMGLRGLTP